nr:unnamed protein product [Callosobruchus analis]
MAQTSELKMLIRKRGSLKSRLTSFERFIGEITDTSPENLSERTTIILADKSSKVSDLEAEFNAVQSDIECLVDDEELDSHFNYREQFTTQLETLVAEAKYMLSLAKNESANSIRDESDRLSGVSESRKTEIYLDKVSAREWEKANFLQVPNMHTFKYFLKNRAQLLESLESKQLGYLKSTDSRPDSRYSHGKPKGSDRLQGKSRSFHVASPDTGSTKFTCPNCKQNHSIYYCPEYLKLLVKDRMTRVQRLRLCINCLRPSHEAKECRSSRCRVCKGLHNTSLHEEKKACALTSTSEVGAKETEASRGRELDSTPSTDIAEREIVSCTSTTSNQAILSTALLHVYDSQGERHTIRALIDCGSQSSFITEELCNILRTPRSSVKISISGISGNSSAINHKCNLKLFSTTSGYSFNLDVFVINRITGNLPGVFFSKRELNIPVNIKLADPTLNIPSKIDILLGADIFWNLLCIGQIQLGKSQPMLQKTRLGWILGGRFNQPEADIKCHFLQLKEKSDSQIQTQLSKFWEVEEIPPKRFFSEEEQQCENHFVENLQVSESGRYVVSLPLKHDTTLLGESRNLALKRFHQLERKLTTNDKLKKLYVQFLDEYLSLGHMSLVENPIENDGYYMPHHGVLRENSISTKLRVVFNASAPSSTGISFNDLQMTGPTIQDDLVSIRLRFRLHKIVISADIKMMYRQITICPEQRKFHRIVWRATPDKPIETYELNTVTYGTTSASFLATRCLHQLAQEVEAEEPQIARVIKHDMYMDDILTGTDSIHSAQKLSIKILSIFKTRCFELVKWRSNSPEVLKFISSQHSPDAVLELSLGQEINCKTLELHCFCDASESAYGSCVYIRSWNKTGYCSVELLCAKSKVAPLKTLTVPRLELCAALVLSRLATKFLNSVNLSFSKIYCWSDSTIVLNWLQTPPHMLKQFVNNRVAEIQELSANFEWRHVLSGDNPADLLTRGLSPENLIKNDLWWHGPHWLKQSSVHWPCSIIEKVEVPEQRRVLHIQLSTIDISFERFSNLSRLQRSFAYVLRFISKCRNSKTFTTSYLSVEELNNTAHIGIRWRFIPVNSPNFGGLWEAGVKSLKSHLKRVAGEFSFSYEDFSTLIIQIEGVLNSRPMSPLSPEPNDLSPLTPAHFLLGRSMQDVPEANFTPLPANRLSSYEFICKLKQQFWERWSKEYISELQQRQKWKKTKNTLQVGQMVLVKEPNLPPLKWRLGRVLSLIPGPDDVPRVAVLKTSIGTIKRALNRLCVLPVHHYVENTIFKAGGNVQETADYATVEEYADSAAA